MGNLCAACKKKGGKKKRKQFSAKKKRDWGEGEEVKVGLNEGVMGVEAFHERNRKEYGLNVHGQELGNSNA